MSKYPITIIAHNIRSLYNVGSLFRIADAGGIEKLILTGISGHPSIQYDKRPYHVQSRQNDRINKVALGAEKYVNWEYQENPQKAIQLLRKKRYQIISMETTPMAQNIIDFSFKFPLALIFGNEVTGLPNKILTISDAALLLPMHGKKESLNVATACSASIYLVIDRFTKNRNNINK